MGTQQRRANTIISNNISRKGTVFVFKHYNNFLYITMGNVFGSEKPLKEVLRENKRMITRAIRELDREKAGLEREEKRITMEIKKAAKENQMSTVKIMAKVNTI
jgi:3-polyprenyl-4-hydroxybenzoate decarboxylase